PFDAWDFLSELSAIEVASDHGREMRTVGNTALHKLVGQYLAGEFSCTLQLPYKEEDPWEILAENKFSQPVGICRCRGTKGTVIVLPQIANKAEFLTNLFTTVLPELAPHLFPHIEGGRWTQRAEYELPRIVEL